MENQNCSYDVMETYCLEHTKQELVSDTLPYHVYLYGSTNGQKYRVYLSRFESEPNKAFYDSFDIVLPEIRK